LKYKLNCSLLAFSKSPLKYVALGKISKEIQGLSSSQKLEFNPLAKVIFPLFTISIPLCIIKSETISKKLSIFSKSLTEKSNEFTRFIKKLFSFFSVTSLKTGSLTICELIHKSVNKLKLYLSLTKILSAFLNIF